VVRAHYCTMFARFVCESRESAVDLGCDLSRFDLNSAIFTCNCIKQLRLSERPSRSAVMSCSERVVTSPAVRASSSLLESVGVMVRTCTASSSGRTRIRDLAVGHGTIDAICALITVVSPKAGEISHAPRGCSMRKG